MGTYEGVESAFLIHILLSSSLFSILVVVAEGVDGDAVTVNVHLRPYPVQLEGVRLSLLQFI